MVHPNTRFLRAVGTMIGSIVGVGVFGLPYAFSQSGFVVGALWLVFLGIVLTIMQLMYAEVAIQTPGSHRLVGHVRTYVGETASRVTLVCLAVALWGAMLAYLIIGGHFLYVLFQPFFGGVEWMYSLVLAVIASWLVHQDIKAASKMEVWVVVALLFLFTVVTLSALPHMQAEHLVRVSFNNAFVPYGVVLFSLAGMGVIPEMKDVLGRKQQKLLPYAVLIGMATISLIYLLFAWAVVGATGDQTTLSAFDGLTLVLGPSFAVIGSALGALCILSIYMLLGIELKHTLMFDFAMKPRASYWLVILVPIVLYIIGVREFIGVVGFVGGVFAGLLGMIVVHTYERMRRSPVCVRHHCLNVPRIVSWMVMGVFAVGIVAQLIASFA